MVVYVSGCRNAMADGRVSNNSYKSKCKSLYVSLGMLCFVAKSLLVSYQVLFSIAGDFGKCNGGEGASFEQYVEIIQIWRRDYHFSQRIGR